MKVVRTLAEGRTLSRGRTVLVPTMGALHEGHLRLFSRASELGDTLMATIFVNPLQFNDPADLQRYPRDLERDTELAASAGVDVLVTPSVEEMIPVSPEVTVVTTGVSDLMEGRHRPGHFDGVATIVTKLLAGLRPDVACFGRKDAQQLSVVVTLVRDLSLPVEIVGAPTFREVDGLAFSSRNVFLGEARDDASALSHALFAAADAVEAGVRDSESLEAIVRREMGAIEPEYVTLAAHPAARPTPQITSTSYLAVAARVGTVRLIDNVWFDVHDGVVTVDRGIPLTDRTT